MTDLQRMPGEQSESIIYCEGYHDRAFWAGWLMRLGCTDARLQPGRRDPQKAMDPFGDPVGQGHFAYRTPRNAFLRVVPCQGKENVLRTAEDRLRDRASKEITAMVINADLDLPAGAPGGGVGPNSQNIDNMLRQVDPAVNRLTDALWTVGAARVHLLRWQAPDPDTEILPREQTLERLICASVVAAYPDRGVTVADWLSSRSGPMETKPKNYLWSHMAGWFAEHGCEDFFRRLWEDDAVAAQLEKRLREIGAWPIVAALAQQTDTTGSSQ